MYEDLKKGKKFSEIEQLALEEELVERKVIDHSPMHEKLYTMRKKLFK